MKRLNKVLEELNESRAKTPQAQLDTVIDISRRGFLKDVLNTTILGLTISTCSHTSFAGGIDGLPDMGDSDRSNLSPYQADLLGRQVILDIYSQGSMLEDFDCLDYLNSLGNTLVSHSPMAGEPFNFYLIKDKEINAFALPGGYICVYNGLLYSTLSEAELSSVLSHEIGHVIQHHIFRNISVQNRAQWAGIAGLLAGALLAPFNPGMAVVAAQSGQGLGIQNMLSFSRDYEREADRVGQQLMYHAGFDAHAMPEFFHRMQNAYKFNTNDALAFLQTHPVTVERLSEAEARANQLEVKMRQDSIDFLLVREKCRVRQISPDDAIQFYLKAIQGKRYVSLPAQQYGLALSYYLTKNFSASFAILNKIHGANYLGHPIILGLRARLLIAVRNYKQADKVYDHSIASYPNHKGLWMGQLEFLISSKNYKKAASRLELLIQDNAKDPDTWDQYAILYADTRYNNPIRYHYGLGNEFYTLGNYQMALDQFQLALKAKAKQPGDDIIQDEVSAQIPDTIRKMKS